MPTGDPFWRQHFLRIAVSQVEMLREVLIERLLPTFENIEEEATRHADELYEELGNLPGGDDGPDMGDFAEIARDAGQDRYDALADARQAVLNAMTVSLYHLVEQHLLRFHRQHVLHPSEEDNEKLWWLEELFDRLSEMGLDVRLLPSWKKVEELQHTANAIKHADGRAANRLRKVRPDLFVSPLLRNGDPRFLRGTTPVFTPMAGDDIYVSVDDFTVFAAATIRFFEEFADAIYPH